jgi:hypothetical protein
MIIIRIVWTEIHIHAKQEHSDLPWESQDLKNERQLEFNFSMPLLEMSGRFVPRESIQASHANLSRSGSLDLSKARCSHLETIEIPSPSSSEVCDEVTHDCVPTSGNPRDDAPQTLAFAPPPPQAPFTPSRAPKPTTPTANPRSFYRRQTAALIDKLDLLLDMPKARSSPARPGRARDSHSARAVARTKPRARNLVLRQAVDLIWSIQCDEQVKRHGVRDPSGTATVGLPFPHWF